MMLARLGISVVIAAVVAWQLGYYQLQNVSSTILDIVNKILENVINQDSDQTPEKKDIPAPSKQGDKSTRLLTKEELAQYNGKEGSKGLYLAVFGRVFDVEKGARHYGPGGGYAFFGGRDATRAFVTGEFNDNGLVDDVEGLSPGQMLEVETWVDFYRKEYTPVGKLIGRFYDSLGNPTEALRKAELVLEEGQKEKDEENELNKRFPPCNTSWKQSEGSKVWCSDKSGGINRDWVGLPRRYFAPGSANWRCVCVHDRDLEDPHIKLIEGCNPKSVSCSMNQ